MKNILNKNLQKKIERKIDWTIIQSEMKENFGTDIYDSWLRKIDFVEEFQNYILISVSTRFIRDWITSRYLDQIFKIIAGSIESVYNGDEVFTADDWTEKEVNEFIDSFNIDQFNLIQQFLTDIPRIEETMEFSCVACGKANKRVLSGIQDFFS